MVLRSAGPSCLDLRIDPDGGVLDGQRGAALRAFVGAGQDRDARRPDLPGLGVDLLLAGREQHPLDAEIAEPGGGARQAERAAVADELYVALRGQHADAVTDRVLAAEARPVLVALREAQRGIELPARGLVEQELEDHVALAQTLRVELLPEIAAHDALAGGIELHPSAVALVDQLCGQRGPI